MKDRIYELLLKSKLTVSKTEWTGREIAEFGLGDYERQGACILTLIKTERIAMKILILLPNQVLPEHWHVDTGTHRAKEEVLRSVYGTLYLYTPGSNTSSPRLPAGMENVYLSRFETILTPGMQSYVPPGTPHWFAAGDEGCVALSISSEAQDLTDRFTDPRVVR